MESQRREPGPGRWAQHAEAPPRLRHVCKRSEDMGEMQSLGSVSPVWGEGGGGSFISRQLPAAGCCWPPKPRFDVQGLGPGVLHVPVSVNKVLPKLSYIHSFIPSPPSCDGFSTTAGPPSLRSQFCTVSLRLQVFHGKFQKYTIRKFLIARRSE